MSGPEGSGPDHGALDQPRQVDGVVECQVQEDLLVYEPTGAIAVSLNASAGAIWELCRGRLSVGEIAVELGRRHGLPPRLLRPDVDAAIARLRDAGILRPARPGAAPPGTPTSPPA